MKIEKGSILLIKNFPGHCGPIEKFVYVLGHASPSSILVFTISSQAKYESQPHYRREMVKIPKGTFACLKLDSWIQCFHCAHEIQLGSYVIERKVSAYAQYFLAVKNVIAHSDILNRLQISDYLDIMENDRSVAP